MKWFLKISLFCLIILFSCNEDEQIKTDLPIEINTELVIVSAAFSPRTGHSVTVFKDKMWLIGGFSWDAENQSSELYNDVWYSENGKDWILALDNAPFEPRGFHSSVVYNDKLYVIGGGDMTFSHFTNECIAQDVWYTDDGFSWQLVNGGCNDDAGFSLKMFHTSTVFKDKISLSGGINASDHCCPSNYYYDIFYSSNVQFEEYRDPIDNSYVTLGISDATRRRHKAFVFNDVLYIPTGVSILKIEDWELSPEKIFLQNDDIFDGPYNSVVYNNEIFYIGGISSLNYYSHVHGNGVIENNIVSTSDFLTRKEYNGSADFSNLYNHEMCVFKNKIWIIGGTIFDTSSQDVNSVYSVYLD